MWSRGYVVESFIISRYSALPTKVTWELQALHWHVGVRSELRQHQRLPPRRFSKDHTNADLRMTTEPRSMPSMSLLPKLAFALVVIRSKPAKLSVNGVHQLLSIGRWACY